MGFLGLLTSPAVVMGNRGWAQTQKQRSGVIGQALRVQAQVGK